MTFPAERIDVGAPGAVDRAAATVRAGGTVVVPTDTVYGVAALPSVPEATEALFALKERSNRQPLAVLVADVAQALDLVVPPAGPVRRWIDELWPGPLTLVLTRAPAARALELGGDAATIGVRCPDHDFVRALAAQVGPIATTSANLHGQPTPTTASEAAASLAGRVSLVIDGGPSTAIASTVVDATADSWRVLREGALSVDRLTA